MIFGSLNSSVPLSLQNSGQWKDKVLSLNIKNHITRKGPLINLIKRHNRKNSIMKMQSEGLRGGHFSFINRNAEAYNKLSGFILLKLLPVWK